MDMPEPEKTKAKCECETCKLSRRIQAEWENMNLATQGIVDELFGRVMNAEEDATYWKMRAHNQWPDHSEGEPSPEGTLRTLGEKSEERKV